MAEVRLDSPDPAAAEAALLERLRAGDEMAFEALVARHYGTMLAVAQTNVKGRAVAEEVVQEAWLGVINGLDRFEGRSSLKTWIFRIPTNTASTRGQRERRSIPFSSMNGSAGEGDSGLDPDRFFPPDHSRYPNHWSVGPTPWETPEEGLLSGETRETILRAVEELPAAQRTVVTLRDVEGWPPEEGVRRARADRRQPARPSAPGPVEGPRRAGAVLRRGRGDRARGRELNPMPVQPSYHWRVWAAEAAGTALLVLAIVLAVSLALGEGSPVADALPGRGAGFLLVGVLVAPCVALIAVSLLGRLSGAHLNPALTLGFWALGRVSRHDLAGYVARSSWAARRAHSRGACCCRRRSRARSAARSPTRAVATGAALALESGMTALLVGVVLAFVSSDRLMRWTPLAIVPVLTAIIWLGSPWTGASLNPARSGGPAVAFGDYADLWLYFAAPAAAGLAVGVLWRRLSMPRQRMAGLCPVTPAVLGALPAQTPKLGGRPMAKATATAERTKGLRGLKDKNVLVTGGSSGIGQAIAVRFAEYGANVAINYLRQAEEAQETEDQVRACVNKVQQEGVQDVLVRGDVSQEDDVVHMVGEAVEGLGGVDVLVNNAGIQISRPTEELSSEDFDKVLAVNLRGSFMCAREAIRHFLAEEKPGVIINISSVHQLIPKPGYLGYSTSKGGMQNLTRTLALEYAARGIRVNGVGPGATVTPINRAWIDDPEKRKQVEEHIPMQRAGDSDEIAGVTAFLASDDAAYITGQTIFVDGGLTLFPSFSTPWSSE